MKKTLLIILLSLFIFNCTHDQEGFITDSEQTADGVMTEKQLSNFRSANEKFALKIFSEIVSQSEEDINTMISPMSISIALSMLNNGASENTKTEIKSVLEYSELPDYCINKGYRDLIDELHCYNDVMDLNIANSNWFDDDFPVIEEYVNVNQEYFDAEVINMDFQAPDALDSVNTWVSRKTDGKIESIFDQMPDVVFLLINAINFQGFWKFPFDPEETLNTRFYNEDGSYKSTPTMICEYAYNSPLLNFEFLIRDTFKAVKIPYGKKQADQLSEKLGCVPFDNDNVSMYVFVPQTDLEQFIINELNQTKWTDWMSSFESYDEVFNTSEFLFRLPKFKFDYDKDLIPVLASLGMTDAFSASNSNFSNMTEYWQGLFINLIKHKTCVDVNEEGTSAAAVTVVGGTYGFIPEFLANKPFLFAVRDDLTGTILFMGQVYDPEY